MSSRNMCLLPRATLHSDSEQLVIELNPAMRSIMSCWWPLCCSLYLCSFFTSGGLHPTGRHRWRKIHPKQQLKVNQKLLIFSAMNILSSNLRIFWAMDLTYGYPELRISWATYILNYRYSEPQIFGANRCLQQRIFWATDILSSRFSGSWIFFSYYNARRVISEFPWLKISVTQNVCS